MMLTRQKAFDRIYLGKNLCKSRKETKLNEIKTQSKHEIVLTSILSISNHLLYWRYIGN